jgi:hypothetical protein
MDFRLPTGQMIEQICSSKNNSQTEIKAMLPDFLSGLKAHFFRFDSESKEMVMITTHRSSAGAQEYVPALLRDYGCL